MSARPVLVTGEAGDSPAAPVPSVPQSASPGTAEAALAEERLVAALTLHVGVGRPRSNEQFAKAIGLNPETYRAVVSPSPAKRRRMRFGDGLAALARFGEDDLNHVLRAVGFSGARAAHVGGVCDMAVLAKLCGTAQQLSLALVDNRVDHREGAELAVTLRELLAMIECCLGRLEGEAA